LANSQLTGPGGASRDPSASFRDPAGTVFTTEGRIFRAVRPDGLDDLTAFLSSTAGQRAAGAGQLVRTDEVPSGDAERLLDAQGLAAGAWKLFEHERIPFPSYPYEWAPEMLHAAGMLTLDLALGLLEEGLGVKDGTPYNVLFRGPDPVFVDVLSFERRDPLDPTWLPYAQFVRTFLLPLLAVKHFGIGLDQLMLTRRDGLEPEDVYRWTGPFQKLRPPFLSLVSMPTWLASRHDQDDPSLYRKRSAGSEEKAKFIVGTLLRRLRRTLGRLEPDQGRQSTWSGYMETKTHYSDSSFAAKQAFVERALDEFGPKTVLDAGCNTGYFSAISARRGAAVVAADYDPVVIGGVWRRACEERLDILPLVVNLTRPSPAVGWRNRECPSFLERAFGRFDAVLMLAVLHHMIVTERVPVDEVVDLAADLTRSVAVVEFIAPEDPMFRRLTRGREALHADLTTAVFESSCRRRFDIVRSQSLGEGSTRTMYLLRKRS
jgi:SAM-dependent methyltransferase